MTTKKIRGDHARFRKIINGKLNERMKKFVKTGHLLRMRPNGKGKMSIPLPQIDQPQFRFGKPDHGVHRGPQKPGDVVDKDWEPGHGPDAGEDPGGGMIVDVDVEEVFDIMYEHLRLPRMKPKNANTYETLQTKYNDISKTGPRSLIHKRRSIKQAMKRSVAQGTWGNKILMPGFTVPIPVLQLCKEDFLYRQWNQVKIPRANCLLFFARDGSYSMDDFKCNIVSDLSYWIEKWISRDYEKSESVYIWHDTEAKEVSQEDFYHLRHGGGTMCSSALRLVDKLIKRNYPPEKWNIYFFYFGDGENFKKDNAQFLDLLLKLEEKMNLAAVCQVLASDWDGSIVQYVYDNVDKFKGTDFIRTASVGGDKGLENEDETTYYGGDDRDERLDEEMRKAIIDILGTRDDDEDYYMGDAI